MAELTLINGGMLFILHLFCPYILLSILSFIDILGESLLDFSPDVFSVFVVDTVLLFITGVWKTSSLLTQML